MILEDEFKSSYDCKECGGAGLKRVNCLKCGGSGKIRPENHPLYESNLDICGKCDGLGFKDVTCSACNGKGAIIEIPENSRKKPTSGTIVSCGPECKLYEVGDRVCYSSYTGHFLPFNKNDRIKVMRETETMCLLEDVDPTSPSLEDVEFSSSDNPYDGVVTQ